MQYPTDLKFVARVVCKDLIVCRIVNSRVVLLARLFALANYEVQNACDSLLYFFHYTLINIAPSRSKLKLNISISRTY